MSQEEERIKKMVQQAAGIVSASEKKVGITKAMELVGFSVEERRKMTMHQQVRRLAMKVSVVVAPLPAAAVNASDDVSSLTPTSESNQDSEVLLLFGAVCCLPHPALTLHPAKRLSKNQDAHRRKCSEKRQPTPSLN